MRHLGKFEQAHRGTLFLDEIGDMPLAMQAKLLRVLEESEVERIGGDKPITVDVRVVVATHRDLEELAKQGAFRRDLYHRIYVFPIVLPTLRRQHEHGAIAAKFELAYLRSLDIGNPPKAEAASLYAKYIDTNTSPDPAAYKPLQDYLFRMIALECGRLGM